MSVVKKFIKLWVLNRSDCIMCKKDLCKNCIGHKGSAIDDYDEFYCKKCWDIGEYYRKEIEKHEKIIEKLEDEWLNKCK